MKATTQAVTAGVRASIKGATIPAVTHRSSSSAAGPSTEISPSSRNDRSLRRLPRSVLRNLVELHHHSSTFLNDPSTVSTGFKTAFNALSTPQLTRYDRWAAEQRNLHERRGLAGLKNLRIKHEHGVAAALKSNEERPPPARISRSAWSGEESWKLGSERMLTEREARVKEALYGTWERKAYGTGIEKDKVDVGLDGVEEYMQARGEKRQDVAMSWQERHEPA